MTSFLVLSYRHHLTPFAWRLQREGHTVESICFKPRYERAWAGALPSSLAGGPKRVADFQAQFASLLPQIDAGDVVVLHDHTKWTSIVPNAQFPTLPIAPGEPMTPIRLGGWFDGERVVCPHLLIEDRGAWPGGFGPAVAGGLTVVRPVQWPSAFEEAVQTPVDALKSAGFKGLVGVSAKLSPEGICEATGWQAGWHGLHGHAFLAALGTEGVPFGSVLLGLDVPALAHRFTVVCPVTVPPWPLEANVSSREVPLPLTPSQQANLFLHDVRVDREAKQLWVAGLNGLIGVARGCADVWELAQARVRGVAGSVQVPEVQWRPDVGHSVPGVLAMLESVGLPVV